MRHLLVSGDQVLASVVGKMDSWAKMRRVEVQRWPAVPTAPNTIARIAEIQFALGATMMRVVAAEFEQAAAQATADTLRAT